MDVSENRVYYDNNKVERSRKILIVSFDCDFLEDWNLDGCDEWFLVILCDFNLSVCIVWFEDEMDLDFVFEDFWICDDKFYEWCVIFFWIYSYLKNWINWNF